MRDYFDHAYETFLEILEAFAGIGKGVAITCIYITTPLWIIPYAIGKKLKQRRGNNNNV